VRHQGTLLCRGCSQVVESVPTPSHLKTTTDQQRRDELSVHINEMRDMRQGTLSASNKAVSLESISHTATGTNISSGSSRTVSLEPFDPKTQTSSGLLRDAVGGSDRNISEKNVRAPLSSSSFRLSREIKDATQVIQY